jgi:hypothetical protein
LVDLTVIAQYLVYQEVFRRFYLKFKWCFNSRLPLQESATSLDEIVVFSNNLKRIQQIGASTKNWADR